jgi:hypothetical protein
METRGWGKEDVGMPIAPDRDSSPCTLFAPVDSITASDAKSLAALGIPYSALRSPVTSVE